MSRVQSPEHEALCRRCGRCCYEKFIIEGRVFTTRRPCHCLDLNTNLCTVYDRRFTVNPRCLDVTRGIEMGVFSADCPYVAGMAQYLPAENGWLGEETVRRIERGLLCTCEDVLAEMHQDE